MLEDQMKRLKDSALLDTIIEHYHHGHYDRLIACVLSSLSEPEKSLPEISYYVAKSYQSLGEPGTARTWFQQAIAGNSSDKIRTSDCYDGMGLCLTQLGQYPTAEECYEEALSANPLNRSAQHNLALHYLICAQQQSDPLSPEEWLRIYNKSQALLNEILQHDATNAHALHTKGSWCELQKHYAEAIDFYKQARIHCLPGDNDTHRAIAINLSECYAQLGHMAYRTLDFALAQFYYKQSLKENKDASVARNQLGMCFYKAKQFLVGRMQFNELVNNAETDQDKADALMNRAACCREIRQYTRAITDLEQARLLAPMDEALPDEEQALQCAAASQIQSQWRLFSDKKKSIAETSAIALTAASSACGLSKAW